MVSSRASYDCSLRGIDLGRFWRGIGEVGLLISYFKKWLETQAHKIPAVWSWQWPWEWSARGIPFVSELLGCDDFTSAGKHPDVCLLEKKHDWRSLTCVKSECVRWHFTVIVFNWVKLSDNDYRNAFFKVNSAFFCQGKGIFLLVFWGPVEYDLKGLSCVSWSDSLSPAVFLQNGMGSPWCF